MEKVRKHRTESWQKPVGRDHWVFESLLHAHLRLAMHSHRSLFSPATVKSPYDVLQFIVVF